MKVFIVRRHWASFMKVVEAQTSWRPAEDRESSATHDGERTGLTCLVSWRRTAEPGVSPSEAWSTQLVMPAQPAPGECRHK